MTSRNPVMPGNPARAAVFGLVAVGLALCLAGSAVAADPYAKGMELFSAGNYPAAITAFSDAIAQTPTDVNAYNFRATSAFFMGEYRKAIDDYSQVILLAPRYPGAFNNRAAAWFQLGQHDRAIADATKAIETGKDVAGAYVTRATAWFYKGDCRRAIADCEAALEKDSENAAALNQLAWILATCPDSEYRSGYQAVKRANKAFVLEPDPSFLDTVAAALAEEGRFAEAVDAQKRLLAAAEGRVSADRMARYRRRLSAYEKEMAWRDGPEGGRAEKPSRDVASVDQGPSRTPPSSADLAPASTRPAASEPARAPVSSGSQAGSHDGPWFTVQVGAYRVPANASSHAQNLVGKGYPARVVVQGSGASAFSLVLLGTYPDYETASRAADSYKTRESASAAVRPDPAPEIEPASPAPAAATPASTSGYAVQVGAYRDETNARGHVDRLRSEGVDARLFVMEDASEKPWYMVRFGAYATEEEAGVAAREFTRGTGQAATVRPVGRL